MNKEILQKAIDTYGTHNQQDMVIEEALELALAILKHRRAVKEECSEEYIKLRRDNIVEERSDTEVMLKQVDIMFDCEEEVNKQIEFKLNRLKERLNSKEE